MSDKAQRGVVARKNIRVRGDVQIELTRVGAERPFRRFTIKNTIVLAGLNSPLYLWKQDIGSPSDWQLTQLIAGSNGTPPTVGDIALVAAVPGGDITLSASDRTLSTSTGELILHGTLTTGQANGYTLREVGIFMGNGQLFARQIHPAIEKTSSITVSYTWRIAVTS